MTSVWTASKSEDALRQEIQAIHEKTEATQESLVEHHRTVVKEVPKKVQELRNEFRYLEDGSS